VATERERGTAAFILSKTVSRGAFLAAKAIAIGVVLLVATILAVVVGWIYTAVLFEPPSVGGWIALALLAWLGLAAWASITSLGSTVTGSVAAAGGLGFLAFLILSVLAAIPNVGRLTPGGLAEPALNLAIGTPVELGDVVVPVVATTALIVACLAGSVWSFQRQEL